jgi:hypothetical protein
MENTPLFKLVYCLKLLLFGVNTFITTRLTAKATTQNAIRKRGVSDTLSPL